MKHKILPVAFFIFCLVPTFFTSAIAFDNSSFRAEETKKFQQKTADATDNQLSGRATIIGEVKAAITCIPTPLEGAKVLVIRMIPLGWFFSKYEAMTDHTGKYQTEVITGFYRVFVRKEGFIQSSPSIFHFIRAESDQIHNCSFIVRPRVLPIS